MGTEVIIKNKFTKGKKNMFPEIIIYLQLLIILNGGIWELLYAYNILKLICELRNSIWYFRDWIPYFLPVIKVIVRGQLTKYWKDHWCHYFDFTFHARDYVTPTANQPRINDSYILIHWAFLFIPFLKCETWGVFNSQVW